MAEHAGPLTANGAGREEQRIHGSFPAKGAPKHAVTGVTGKGNSKDAGGIPRGKGSQQAKNKFYYSEA